MTGVLEEPVGHRDESRLRGPGLCKRRGIVDCEPVEDRVLADAREALDDMQIFARTAKHGLASKVGGVDNQRVAFPMAYRIADPEANVGREMSTAVQRNDPRVVDLFDKNHHILRGLDDL